MSPQVHGHYNIIHIKNQYNIDSIVTHGIKNTHVCGCFLFLEDNHPQKSLIFAGPGLVGLSPSVLVRGDTRKKSPEWGGFYFWWPWSDSNRHSLQNLILSQARLPIPPRGQNHSDYFAAVFAATFLTKRALRAGLCTGFFAGAAGLPTFFSMAFLIAAISSVRRDTGFAIT